MNPNYILRSCLVLWLCVLCCSPGWASEPRKDDIAAIEFLGTVDCQWYPEAQEALINVLNEDPREEVRFAAVKALTQQLQRGERPLDPLAGWRPFPDREILTQIVRVAVLKKPLTTEELLDRYAERKFQKILNDKKEQRRKDVHRSCCTPEVIEALSEAAHGVDESGLYVEPSDRVRAYAEQALSLCIDVVMLAPSEPPPTEPPPTDQPPTEPPPVVEPPVVQPPSRQFSASIGRNAPIIIGRADTTNRFNVFDNMGAAPRSRAWIGYQLAKSQNNAIILTPQTKQLFSILKTASGRSAFITFTGFGRSKAEVGPTVDPTPASSEEVLKNLYLEANAGRGLAFLLNPDTNLYRFGFEYAITPDFSVGMQGQYVTPLDDVQQPDQFSNPQIMLKHVIYRSDETILSLLFGIQPQIPKPRFAIGEDTSRLNPGLLAYHKLNEEWFTQGALGFNFPTEGNQITTVDYALSLGYWLYQHESLNPYYQGEKSSKFLLGIIPQFEVLAKHVLGDTTVRGIFDLSVEQPQTASGTVSSVDGSTNIYFPQNPSLLVFQEPLIFEEPRHVVDLTFGLSFLFRNNLQFSTGLSFPVTGGTARQLEFMSTLNYSF